MLSWPKWLEHSAKTLSSYFLSSSCNWQQITFFSFMQKPTEKPLKAVNWLKTLLISELLQVGHKEFTLSIVGRSSLRFTWDCYLHKHKQMNLLTHFTQLIKKKNWPLTCTLHGIPECLTVLVYIETRSRFHSALLKIQHMTTSVKIWSENIIHNEW